MFAGDFDSLDTVPEISEEELSDLVGAEGGDPMDPATDITGISVNRIPNAIPIAADETGWIRRYEH